MPYFFLEIDGALYQFTRTAWARYLRLRLRRLDVDDTSLPEHLKGITRVPKFLHATDTCSDDKLRRMLDAATKEVSK